MISNRFNSAAFSREIRRSRALRPFPLTALSAALALLAAPGDAGAQANAGSSARVPGPPMFAAGRILLQPRAGLSDKELDKILKPHGGKRAGHLKKINVHVIELPPQANEDAIARALAKNPHVKFAELDVRGEAAITTNDPQLGNQWHVPRIRANDAWDTTAAAGITIAILDTGVQGTHPDLAAAMVPGWNLYDDNADTSDVHGHGTAVAGAAAGVGNNAVGVAGIAWRARIMPVRIADANAYAFWSTMAQGITFAADNGAKVANLSYQNSCGSATVVSAAQYMRSKGGVVVISAGNTSGEIADADSPDVTCVSATDSNDARTSWSSYGRAVDLSAPGAGIVTTKRGDGYMNANGTSFAAPITAGTYALMMAANGALPPGSLDDILFSTAVDLGTTGKDFYYGNGRVNAVAAVTKATQTAAADTTPPTVSLSNPKSGSRVNGLVAVDASATDASGVARVDLYVNNALYASDSFPPFGFSWDASAMQDGPATLMAKAYDVSGNSGSSAAVGVTVSNDTEPPTVGIDNPADGGTVSGTVSVSVRAQDNVRVAKITLVIDGKEVAQSLGSSLSYTWNTTTKTKNRKSRGSTTSSLTARAEDPAGNVASTTVNVIKM